VIAQLPAVAPTAAGMVRVAGSVTAPEPAAATTAPAPEQVVEAFGVGATTTGEGSVSTSAPVRLATEAVRVGERDGELRGDVSR